MIDNEIEANAGSEKDSSVTIVRGGVNEERSRGIKPSGIGNVTTMCGSGEESTSTIAFPEHWVGHPGTISGPQVSVEPSGDLDTVVLALVSAPLKEQRGAGRTTLDPAADLARKKSVLVAKALQDERNARANGCGTKSFVWISTATVPSGTGRALSLGVPMRAAPHINKEQLSIGITLNFNQGDTSHDCRKNRAFVYAAMTTKLPCTSAASIITSEDHTKI
jgi:hypothetical protein